MKLKKSGIFTKIIIVLIVVIIFNAVVPKELLAVDFGGILLKPTAALLLHILVSADAMIGVFLMATETLMGGLGEIISDLLDGSSSLADTILVGPDTIFSGKVGLLDANIFDVTVSGNLITRY